VTRPAQALHTALVDSARDSPGLGLGDSQSRTVCPTRGLHTESAGGVSLSGAGPPLVAD
jgi:hypothetical protein